MGLFSKFKAGLAKTHAKLTHEIKRIVTRSPKLTAESLEEIEHALIAADLGMAMTTQIVAAVKIAYETQGSAGLDYLAIARAEIEKSLVHEQTRLARNCRRRLRRFNCWRERHRQNHDERETRKLFSVAEKIRRCSPRATRFARRRSSN